MKKLGTPISAGPGSASEKDGVPALGTPAPVIAAPGAAWGFDCLAGAVFGAAGAGAGALWAEGRSPRVRPGAGEDDELVVVEDERELVEDREVEVEVVEVVLDEAGAAEELVVVVVELEELVGAQLSVSEATTPVTGSDIWEIGVPGGTLTSNVYVWPPTTVTCTVQASADALGSAVNAITTSRALIVSNPAISLRRRVKPALLLQPSCVCALHYLDEGSGKAARY